MRPLTFSDLETAARAVATKPLACRPAAAAIIVKTAQSADRYRQRRGHYHPVWGSGTLYSASCNLRLATKDQLYAPEGLPSFVAVLGAVLSLGTDQET